MIPKFEVGDLVSYRVKWGPKGGGRGVGIVLGVEKEYLFGEAHLIDPVALGLNPEYLYSIFWFDAGATAKISQDFLAVVS